MAWRPYENLIDGELDNTQPGKVTGWIRFLRKGQEPLRITLELTGDFHEDIKGQKIRISNPCPKDRNDVLFPGRYGSYVDGFTEKQVGEVGDITAGQKVHGTYPYTTYPYIEWYSESNWRVVLELDSDQVEVVAATNQKVEHIQTPTTVNP